MNPFLRFVSRKVLATAAVFAAVAASVLASYAVVRGVTSSPDTASVGLTSEAAAFDAALADPAPALDVATDPGDPNAPADPGDTGGGWQQLRADLKAARDLDGDASREALAAIRAKAQDGGYGDRIERHADRRQIHRDLFFSLLPDNLQSDLHELQDAPADERDQLRADIIDRALAGDYGPEVQKAAEQLQELRKG